MGLRTLLRTGTALAATTVVAALLTAPTATARPCANCDDPKLPDDPGYPCPTITATTDPWIQAPVSPAPARVGMTVTARTGVWDNDTEAMKARWYVGSTGVGETFDFPSNAPNRTLTYVIQPSDVGKPIRLWVRGVGPQPQCVHDEYSDATAAVELGDAPIVDVLPTISGVAKVGETLTADPGTWIPAADSHTYTWFSDGGSEDGVERGTGPTYTVRAEDHGQNLRVEIRTVRSGHHSAMTVVRTGTVAPGPKPAWKGKKAKLKGKDRVGKVVKVALGKKKLRKRASAPDATVSFQWLRRGKVVKASTKRAHRIVKADRKKPLKARIRIVRPGHEPLVITTKAVKIKNNGKKIR